jgi:predicted TPR repeat methyltransferase
MAITHLTNYDHESTHFAKLREYSIACGTDYLAVRDVLKIISQIKPLIKILDLGCGSGLATR